MSGCCCYSVVGASEVGVIERMGKFHRLAEAGCFPLCYPFEHVVGVISLRVQELKVDIDAKIRDNVFVRVDVTIQYQIVKENVRQAFYVLSGTQIQTQMRAHAYDSIHTSLCQMDLDHAFESKEEISLSLKTHLQEIMTNYGITILNALVTDLSPNSKIIALIKE